uniref:UL17 protein n=1 Tax=Anatid alphaherpesvirus 2 TaxID=3080522 RepID=A0AAU0K6D0_9ALPH
MERHIDNEIEYLIDTGGPTSSRERLVHIIITDSCLGRAGVDVGCLRELASKARRAEESVVPTFPPGGWNGPPSSGRPRTTADVRASFQTRHHAVGTCSEWRPVYASYVDGGVLNDLLIPDVPGHPRAFQRPSGTDCGGVFTSLRITCDEAGRFDPFNVAALRIEIGRGGDVPLRHVDVEFTYEELLPEGTRYGPDEARLNALCIQFLGYAGRTLGGPSDAPLGPTPDLAAVVAEMRSKMEACVGGGGGRSGASAATLDLQAYVDAPGGFDDPKTDERLEREDREIDALIKKAADVINRRRPVGTANRRSDGDERTGGRGHVVSGLRQGALAHAANSAEARTPLDQAAVLSGLEPAGTGRFRGGSDRSRRTDHEDGRRKREPALTQVLEDVLIFDGLDDGPLGPRDILGIAVSAMSGGGEARSAAWRTRPISVVPRTHFGSGARFFVVSYSSSSAWGGRGVEGTSERGEALTTAASAARRLAEACLREGVDGPRELSRAARDALSAEIPALAVPLSGLPTPLTPFSVGAEVELRVGFRVACASAVARAIGDAIMATPTLRQLVEYDVEAAHVGYVTAGATRAPNLVAALVSALSAEAQHVFQTGALYSAALAYAANRLHGNGSRATYAHYSTGVDRRRLDADYDAASYAPADDNLYLFDYYSAGGECVKTSDRPVPVVLDHGRRAYGGASGAPVPPRGPCDVPTWFARGRATCERYLPGESYAYVCVGYNARLDVIVVLPGGFALAGNAARHFDWSDERSEAVLARICRRNQSTQRPIGDFNKC